MYGKPGATDKIIKILKKIDYKDVYKSNFFDMTMLDTVFQYFLTESFTNFRL
jgi:hypothetical protein